MQMSGLKAKGSDFSTCDVESRKMLLAFIGEDSLAFIFCFQLILSKLDFLMHGSMNFDTHVGVEGVCDCERVAPGRALGRWNGPIF